MKMSSLNFELGKFFSFILFIFAIGVILKSRGKAWEVRRRSQILILPYKAYRVKEVIYIRGGGLEFATNRPFDFKDGPCDLRQHIAYIAIKVQTSEN